jgi:hypothetical protein
MAAFVHSDGLLSEALDSHNHMDGKKTETHYPSSYLLPDNHTPT